MTTVVRDVEDRVVLEVSVRRLLPVVLVIDVLFLVAHLAARAVDASGVGAGSRVLREVIRRFDLNDQLSLATLWSMLLLAAIAITALRLAAVHSPDSPTRRGWWIAFAVIAAALWLDEGTGLHSLLTSPMQGVLGPATNGPLYFAWVVPALAAAVILAVVFIPFARTLPRRTAVALGVALAVSAFGAIGMEMLYAGTAVVISGSGLGYLLEVMTGVEQFLQLVGSTMVLAVLLQHLRTQSSDSEPLSIRPTAAVIQRLTVILLALVGLLLTLHVLSRAALRSGFGWPATVSGLFGAMDMDAENTLPTVVTTGILGAIAVAAVVIGRAGRSRSQPGYRWWYGVAAVFGYLAIDEALALHELAFEPAQALLGVTSGPFLFAWVVPAGLAVIVVGILFLRFSIGLPPDTRRAAGIGGAVYLAGALGMEMVAASLVGVLPAGFAFELLSGIEESLELIGAVLVLRALLLHLERHVAPGGEVALSLSR